MTIRIQEVCDVCNFATSWVLMPGARYGDQPEPALKRINNLDVCRSCEAAIEFHVREPEKALVTNGR